MFHWALELALLFTLIVGLVGAAIYFAPPGWRTMIVNGLLSVIIGLGAVLDYAAGFDWREVLPPEVAPWVVLSITMLNLFLRTITSTPVGRKT